MPCQELGRAFLFQTLENLSGFQAYITIPNILPALTELKALSEQRHAFVAVDICHAPSAYCQNPCDHFGDKRIYYQPIHLQDDCKSSDVEGDDHINDYQWQLEH
ncbi:hypothetical protein [Sideroxydans sp. CL21]|uniref:hypothetical protein n=1 Tax=Sideroxydans sp. CL21 TaxID=2600596 RepID=UPI0024BC59A6|nr:hypothetical protein [Sideroxydans sp. CL21]